MSDKINVEAIYSKYAKKYINERGWNIDVKAPYFQEVIKTTIKEIVETVINKCDEKLHCTQENLDKDMKLSESILNIKKEIEYE